MPLRRALLTVPLLLGAVVMLSACVPTETGTIPTNSASAPSSQGPSSTPEPTTTPTTPPPAGEPVTVTCDQIISAQAMYDYNPNFTLLTDFTPDKGSLAAQAVAAKGVACRWINQTSSETIDISVAHLAEADLTAKKNALVTTSNSVPTYGVEGYFAMDGERGVAQAFPDPYWVTATSTAFLEPGDVAPLVEAAIATLG